MFYSVFGTERLNKTRANSETGKFIQTSQSLITSMSKYGGRINTYSSPIKN